MTGNRGIIGGWRFWLLRTFLYLAIFLDGSKRSCRSPNSFSYLLGSFSHVPLSLETGARFRPLWGETCWALAEEHSPRLCYISLSVSLIHFCRSPSVSPDDGEHGVEVLALAAVQRDLDEVLDGLHAFELVRLSRHLRGHPEGLVVNGLLEALQAGRARLGAQLEQVVDVFCGLDGTEEFKSPHGELSGHLHCTELQQRDLAFSQEVLSVLVWTQRLRLHVALQVVSDDRGLFFRSV